MPLTDVQWVLGHAHLTTTQIYLTPRKEDVIAGVPAHHARGAAVRDQPGATGQAPGIPARRWTRCSGDATRDDWYPQRSEAGREPRAGRRAVRAACRGSLPGRGGTTWEARG